MMASVSVTSAARSTVRTMMAGYRCVNSSAKLSATSWCCRLLVNGFTVQKAVTSMTTSDAR